MPRRLLNSESDHHERWVISYADFITLLFAFFVVMYSVSSVHEGKYQILTETLGKIFVEQRVDQTEEGELSGERMDNKRIEKQLEALERISHQQEERIKNQVVDGGVAGQNHEPSETIVESKAESKPEDTTSPSSNRDLKLLADAISSEFEDLISIGEIHVTGNQNSIAIDINSNFLFESGQANPNQQAETIIERIAKWLLASDNPIHVEGFTDNIPIKTSEFPSNWELSSARAAAIVRLLAYFRVDPARMAAVGYGEYQPIASNATEEGRSRNRRVSLVISKHADRREVPSRKVAPVKKNSIESNLEAQSALLNNPFGEALEADSSSQGAELGAGQEKEQESAINLESNRELDNYLEQFNKQTSARTNQGQALELDHKKDKENSGSASLRDLEERGLKTVPLKNGGLLITN